MYLELFLQALEFSKASFQELAPKDFQYLSFGVLILFFIFPLLWQFRKKLKKHVFQKKSSKVFSQDLGQRLYQSLNQQLAFNDLKKDQAQNQEFFYVVLVLYLFWTKMTLKRFLKSSQKQTEVLNWLMHYASSKKILLDDVSFEDVTKYKKELYQKLEDFSLFLETSQRKMFLNSIATVCESTQNQSLACEDLMKRVGLIMNEVGVSWYVSRRECAL